MIVSLCPTARREGLASRAHEKYDQYVEWGRPVLEQHGPKSLTHGPAPRG